MTAATRWRLGAACALSCAAACALLDACASDESGAPPLDPDAVQPDASANDTSLADTEVGPCTDDCEFFPEACGPDILCPTGLFDPKDPTAGMDWRTRINVIRGRSASDVWAAGSVGAMAHFDGASWTISEVGTQEAQRVLWLRDAREISFGSVSRIYTRGHGAGSADAAVSSGGWSLREPPMIPFDFDTKPTASWAMSGSESLWLATDSALWRLHITPESTFEILPGLPPSACTVVPCSHLRSMHAASTNTLWAVGDFGSALRITDLDRDSPKATSLNTSTWLGLAGVWAASDSDVWAVGGAGSIRHYTGDPARWDVVSDVPTNGNLNAVWGTSSSDIWAVGDAGVVLHYDGTIWSRVKIAGLGARRPDLYTVWSPAPGHVWIGGYGILLALGRNP